MRWGPRAALACALLLPLGCNKKEPPAPPPVASAAPAPAASGAPGAGDRSGKSIANAMPVVRGTPTKFRLPCSGAGVFVGPFAFTKSPEILSLRAEIKGTTGEQVCRGEAHFVDGAGGKPAVAGLPCVEGGNPAAVTLTHEHSPHNGGNDANPVFWHLRGGDPLPDGCGTLDVTLTLP